MARLTVSIDDQLKERLKQYADDHDLPVSQVVSQALETFFEGGEPPPPGQPADLIATQGYLSQLVDQLEVVRQSLYQMAIAQQGPFAPFPPGLVEQLARPPWSSPERTEGE